MRPSPSSPSLVRRAPGFALLAALAALSACSEDSPIPGCENCEGWDQLTAGLGRFPEPHPTNASLIAFSTVEKTPGQPDANRESDEDLWLVWVVDREDPAANATWQLTGDEIGSGDNFYPRWAPSGTELAFVHTNDEGRFEVWTLPVAPPSGPGGTPAVGTAQRIGLGRDPTWVSDDRLVFTRGDKLFAVDLTAVRGGAETQLSFNPPVYAATEDFVDRHPDFEDGGGIFNTLGRENVANVYIEAFEVDNEVAPPETLATDAFILYQAPGGTPTYPVFEGADTLRTPATLTSLPVGSGGTFFIGARLDGRFLADSTRETYCDTTITRQVDLSPGETDSISVYFSIARGTLRVQTGLPNTTVFWSRGDGLVDSEDFPQSPVLNNAGDARDWNCLLSYDVVSGVPAPPNLETYLVSASRIGSADWDTTVVVPPGDTTHVVVYPQPPGAAPRRAEPVVIATASGRSRPPAALAGGLPGLRAEGDLGMVWRLDLGGGEVTLSELFGSEALVQNPALSAETAAGKRYVVYASNEEGNWGLYVQKLAVGRSGSTETWTREGPAVRVETPGSPSNLDCARNVFHPRFAPGASAGNLRIVVALADCPDNGFEDIGFDDDPWAIGEIRVWQVEVAIP